MRAHIRLTLLAAALAAGGCTVGPDYVKPADRRAGRLAHRLRAGGRRREHPLVGTVRRPGADRAHRVGAAGEPRPRDRRGARRRVHRHAGVDAGAALSAGQLQRSTRRRARTQRRRRVAAARRRRARTTTSTTARSARSGRSTSSAACAGRPRPRRRRSTRPSRAGAASCCRWSRAWRRATSGCARSTASSRSRSRPPPTSRAPSGSSNCATRAASCRSSRSAQVESQYQQALAAIPQLEQQIAAQENLIAVLQGRNPYADPARQDDRPAREPRDSRGAAGDAARTKAGHPAGRAEPHRRQCRHRRREGALLPAVQPDGCVRHDQRGVRQLPHRSRAGLVARWQG